MGTRILFVAWEPSVGVPIANVHVVVHGIWEHGIALASCSVLGSEATSGFRRLSRVGGVFSPEQKGGALDCESHSGL